jgi:hypothetical protein
VSLRFDEDARHEYLEAIVFYGRAAERFVQAVDAAIAQIRGDPERFREVEPGVRSCPSSEIHVLNPLHAGCSRLVRPCFETR